MIPRQPSPTWAGFNRLVLSADGGASDQLALIRAMLGYSYDSRSLAPDPQFVAAAYIAACPMHANFARRRRAMRSMLAAAAPAARAPALEFLLHRSALFRLEREFLDRGRVAESSIVTAIDDGTPSKYLSEVLEDSVLYDYEKAAAADVMMEWIDDAMDARRFASIALQRLNRIQLIEFRCWFLAAIVRLSHKFALFEFLDDCRVALLAENTNPQSSLPHMLPPLTALVGALKCARMEMSAASIPESFARNDLTYPPLLALFGSCASLIRDSARSTNFATVALDALRTAPENDRLGLTRRTVSALGSAQADYRLEWFGRIWDDASSTAQGSIQPDPLSSTRLILADEMLSAFLAGDGINL